MKIPKTFWRTSGGSEPNSADRLFLSRDSPEPGQVPCSDSKVWSCLTVQVTDLKSEGQNGPVDPQQEGFTLGDIKLKTKLTVV